MSTVADTSAFKNNLSDCSPYQSLAPIYDRIMHHIDYGAWASYIEAVHRKFGKSPNPSILELGCGTGMLGAELLAKHYSYIGSDIAESMCRVAFSRNVPVFCTDARIPSVNKKFNLILFLYDGINYLHSLQEYSKLFSQVHALLEKNALFIFDVTTKKNSNTNFEDFLDYDDFGDHYFIRHSYYKKSDSTQHNDFSIFRRLGTSSTYERFDENHIQRVLDMKEIESSIDTSLFEVLGMFDGYTFRKFTQASNRVHIVVRKKERV